MQFLAMFNLIRRTFRAHEILNCGPTGKAKGTNQTMVGPTGKAKGTNQTMVGQAYAMITRKFRDFE